MTQSAAEYRPSSYLSVDYANHSDRGRSPASSKTASPRYSQQNLRERSAHSTASAGSKSDARYSFPVDLTDVTYVQQAHFASFDNTHLRDAVGTGASLMPLDKKLELMRANVKKTNDAGIQYQYAMFLISEIRELQLRSQEDTDQDLEGLRRSLLKDAKHTLQKGSDRGNPLAQYILADGYSSGFFTSDGQPDHNRAFPLFVSAAKRGHAESSYRTALCYEHGWGSRTDVPKAVLYYQTAASKDHPGATTRLGKACLSSDLGLTGRHREGVRWLRRASENADAHHNEGSYELACLYEHGYGPDIFQDDRYAAELFTKAADLGHAQAGFRLGHAYEDGLLGLPRDAALSLHFHNLAASAGHAEAQMALCAWYMCGAPPVLERDENEACEWARLAAAQGLPRAEYALGYFSEMGIGCRRDVLEANRWLTAAAEHGDLNAIRRRKMIALAADGRGGREGRRAHEKAAAVLRKPMDRSGGSLDTGRMNRAGLTKEELRGSRDDKDCVIM